MSGNQFFPSFLIFLWFLALFIDNVLAQIFNISFTSIVKYFPMISNIFFTVTVREKNTSTSEKARKISLSPWENRKWNSMDFQGLFPYGKSKRIVSTYGHFPPPFKIISKKSPYEFLRC